MHILFKQTALKHIQFIHTNHSKTITLGLRFHLSHKNFGVSGPDFTASNSTSTKVFTAPKSALRFCFIEILYIIFSTRKVSLVCFIRVTGTKDKQKNETISTTSFIIFTPHFTSLCRDEQMFTRLQVCR
jgi:hypothetical protein